jgi:dihydroneopterin aldolase
MATIDLHVQVHAEIGVAPTEVGREQRLDVRVVVALDDAVVDAAAASGRLGDTLDYARLRKIVGDVFAGSPRSDGRPSIVLLEQAVGAIRAEITRLQHVNDVHVTVIKHHPWADVPTVSLTR